MLNHSATLPTATALSAQQQQRQWSLLINHPEDLYAFVKLSSYNGLAHPMPKCRVNIMVFAHMKQLRTYLSRLKCPPAAVMIWHEMDYWGRNRYGNPSEEMKDRMSALVAIAANQPVTIATTCLSLLEKTIPADQFKQQRMVLATGDEVHPDELRAQLKRGGYLMSDHVGGYGTYHQNDRHVHISPPGQMDALRLRFSAQHKLLEIETLQASRRGTGSLSSYEIYPAHETVIVDGESRDKGAQALYENLLQQTTKPQQRTMMLDHFHNHEPFAGYHKLSPLIRKGAGQPESTLLDHLSETAKDDFFIWNFMTQEHKDQVIAEGLARAEECFRLEAEAGEPTIHPQEHFADPQQIAAQIRRDGYQAVLYSYESSDSTVELTHGSMMQLPTPSPVAAEQVTAVMMRDYVRSVMRPGTAMTRNQPASGAAQLSSGYGSVEEFLQALSEGGMQSVEQLVTQNHSGSAALSTDELKEAKVVLMCQEESIMEQWRVLLEGSSPVESLKTPWDTKTILNSPASLFISVGALGRDYYLVYENIHFIPALKLGRSSVRTPRKKDDSKWQDYLRSLSEIVVGDLVVHRDHGVGRYLGLVDLGVHGGAAECLKIEYGGGDKIYVPIHHLSYLQKYSSGLPQPSDEMMNSDNASSGAWSRRNKLDFLAKKSTWKKRSAKIKQSVQDLADEILRIHSRRKLAKREAYAPPPAIYQEFIQGFPYIETADQLRFCEDMEQDFSSGQPMDRLLIGDVGFGKTEMAMRATMRTVLEGYQVMVLCPTTVLCFQHVRTFQSRMASYSVNIAGANRFIKPAELRRVAEQFTSGTLDILIGTHKILAQSFKPHKLGLVIIDEEQRFGVTHKEKIKALKANSAVLALSATPIPRTMHMSMLGLRDISLLTIPPTGRRPVKNTVTTWDDKVIEGAIRAEIRRGGQVFCIHNRVRDLEAFSGRIQALVPELEIRTAHGQMNEVELEKVVLAFSRNEFPILICTSIMEAGVDMPNVNTLIVHKSEYFGLSQLYQLRGRVGRSSVQAYAYFITAPQTQMTDDASRRMQVMMAYQALGSGFSIASYDMDLRGVGDLLGEEQSGHVATVGLEMYTTLLDEALKRARGEQLLENQVCEIRLKTAYGIDKEYMARDNVRLKFYKRLFQLTSAEEIDTLVAEITKEYGPLPASMSVLIQVAMMKLMLRPLGAQSLRETSPGFYEVELSKLPDHTVDTVLEAIRRHPKVYGFIDPTRLSINLTAHSEAKRLALLPHKIAVLWQR